MISKKNVLQVKPIAIASIKIARRTCVSLNALKRFSIRNDLKAQKASWIISQIQVKKNTLNAQRTIQKLLKNLMFIFLFRSDQK
jgi:hypothetical protein